MAWLSEPALEALAALFNITTVTGVFPRQVARLLAPMLPKKAGGHRLIGLFPAYYRLWARSSVEQVKAWEQVIEQPWMAASTGRQPTDSVWRTEVLAEEAQSRGEYAACLTMDISAFYEHVSHEKLASLALDLGFPVGPLRAALRSYKWPRFVTHQKMVGPGICPTRGIVAGCTFATYLVKAYYCKAFGSLHHLWREAALTANLDVFLDDITVSGRASSPQKLVSMMLDNGRAVVEVVNELECTVEPTKTAVAASCRQVAQKIAQHFLRPAAVVAQQDAYGLLGCEVRQAGRWKHRRAPCRTSVRAKRLHTAAARFRRSSVFRRLCGFRSACLYVAGVRSVADYGAEVTGLSDAVVRRLSIWATSFWSRTARSSRTAWMVLCGDPILKPATAAARRWAKEVWSATLDTRTISWPRLCEIFEATGHARSITRWNLVRGPVSAAALELRRLGWSWPRADCFVDDRGHEVHLTTVAPARLVALMGASRTRQLEAALGRKAGVREGVGLGPAKSLLASTGVEARDKAVLRQLVTDSIWTCSDLARYGYPVSPLCPLCGLEPDTLKHRIWQCTHPGAREARAEAGGSADLVSQAMGMDEHQSCRSWCRPLSFNHPPPTSGHWLEHAVWHANNGAEGGEVCWVPCDPAGWRLRPDMRCFTDGSCSQAVWSTGARAGWGVVIMDGSSPKYRGLGPVVQEWAQTAQAGEWLGVVAASTFWSLDFTPPFCDCLGVVRATHQQPGQVLRRGAFWAGALREAISSPNLLGKIWPLTKVKAHRAVTGDTSEADKALILGNDLADEAAKLGASAHAQLAPGEIIVATAEWSNQIAMLKVAAKVLAVFPTMVQHFKGRLSRGPQAGRPGRPPPPPRPPPVPVDRAHRFVALGGGHILCDFCLTRAASWRSAMRRSRREVCPRGCEEMARAIEAQELGHHLVMVSYGGVPSVFCVTCGSRFTTRRAGLARLCPGHTKFGRESASRLRRGLHPDTRKKDPLEAIYRVEGSTLSLVG